MEERMLRVRMGPRSCFRPDEWIHNYSERLRRDSERPENLKNADGEQSSIGRTTKNFYHKAWQTATQRGFTASKTVNKLTQRRLPIDLTLQNELQSTSHEVTKAND